MMLDRIARVALATCADFPDLEEPERLVLDPLRDRGIEPVPAVWDDPAVDWSSFDLVVLRGTWDYAERLEEFMAWIRRADAVTTVLNPPDVVSWNTDKRYLAELAEHDVRIVPTTFLAAHDAPMLPTSGEYVVKPTVSAGSRDTARYLAGRDDAVARAHAERLLAAGREVMIQPYVDTVDDHGETALLYLNGRFSHALRKGPLLESGAAPTTELFAQETIDPRTPSASDRTVADAVTAFLTDRFGTLLYARVDLLEGPDGPMVLEVELTEPSLFIQSDDAAPARLADAISGRLG